MLTAWLKAWWLNTLDEDSVRKWVPPYCTLWLSWALIATFYFPPVTSIYSSMGPAAYWAWVYVAIPANIAPIVGLWMRHGGSSIQAMSDNLLYRDWMGLVLQAAGHFVCHVLMVMFQISAWIAVWTYQGPNNYAGLTIFAATLLLAWTGGTLILCAQCIRKIRIGIKHEREHHQMEVDS